MEAVWIAAAAIGAIVLVGLAVWLIVRQQRATKLDEARAKLDEPHAQRELRPLLSVAIAPGNVESSRGVEINARVANDGGFTARGVEVAAVVDDQIMAHATVDVKARDEIVVPLLIPRNFVAGLSGEHARFTGRFVLRATYGDATVSWEAPNE